MIIIMIIIIIIIVIIIIITKNVVYQLPQRHLLLRPALLLGLRRMEALHDALRVLSGGAWRSAFVDGTNKNDHFGLIRR